MRVVNISPHVPYMAVNAKKEAVVRIPIQARQRMADTRPQVSQGIITPR